MPLSRNDAEVTGKHTRQLREPERRFPTGIARANAPSRLETGAPPEFQISKLAILKAQIRS